MIRPPGMRGAAFGTAADGNGRDDLSARRAISRDLGIPDGWAWLHQVHGAAVLAAAAPGLQGEADALFTGHAGLPLAVATADCVPVILEAETAVGIAHAGWRGVVAGVVPALYEAMAEAGFRPSRAAVGPAIGPCCYEVGHDVAERFDPSRVGVTRRGTPGVDLAGAVADQLPDTSVWSAAACTRCSGEFHSYRETGTRQRQVSVAWLPIG